MKLSQQYTPYHIGGLPFILPQLPSFPLYGSPLTAALANDKLAEFKLQPVVQRVQFTDGVLQLGDFTITFIHVTHSIPDAAHLFIETPVGNFYHGADYKFDLTPADQKRTEFLKIAQPAQGDVLLLVECSGGEQIMPNMTNKQDLIAYFAEKSQRSAKDGGTYFETVNELLLLFEQTDDGAEIKAVVRNLHREKKSE
jgi:mRNA degradation ribonuclease J1/J2